MRFHFPDNSGYATLVIELPMKERNTSVQVENQEILFTGTYKDGVFTIPTIPIVTNSTDDADISIKMSNGTYYYTHIFEVEQHDQYLLYTLRDYIIFLNNYFLTFICSFTFCK